MVRQQKHERGQRRFLRFSVRQCVVLFTVLCVLAALIAPWFQPNAEKRQHKADRRLLKAAQQGDLSGVNKALFAGAQIGAWDENGDTALSLAFKAKNLALVQLLVENGANLDIGYGAGFSPLAFAAGKNDVELIQFLLDAGANADSPRLHECLVHICIENGNLETMELLLEHGARTDIAHPNQGPPLHAAIQSSHPSEIRYAMIEKLLAHGADPQAVGHGRIAMDIAVRQDDVGACDLLRQHGTPYTVREAAFFNRLADVQRMVAETPSLLTEHFSLGYYVKPGEGATLLGIALERGYEELARWLLDAGASVDSSELDGGTPLHMAARGGRTQLVKFLLDRELEVNAFDEYQQTPLHVAAHKGWDDVVAALLDAGADVNAHGDTGETPLHTAAWLGHLQLVKRLLAAGADPTIADSRNGNTPSALARLHGHLDVQKVLESSESAATGAKNDKDTPPISEGSMLEICRGELNT